MAADSAAAGFIGPKRELPTHGLRCLRCTLSMHGFSDGRLGGDGPKSSELPPDGSVLMCGECGKMHRFFFGQGDKPHVASASEEQVQAMVDGGELEPAEATHIIKAARERFYDFTAKVTAMSLHLMVVRFVAEHGRPLEIDIPTMTEGATAAVGIEADHAAVLSRMVAGRSDTLRVLRALFDTVGEACGAGATFFQFQAAVDYLLETGKVDESMLLAHRSWTVEDLVAELIVDPRYRAMTLGPSERSQDISEFDRAFVLGGEGKRN